MISRTIKAIRVNTKKSQLCDQNNVDSFPNLLSCFSYIHRSCALQSRLYEEDKVIHFGGTSVAFMSNLNFIEHIWDELEYWIRIGIYNI